MANLSNNVDYSSVLSDKIYYNTNNPACFSGVTPVFNEAKKLFPTIKIEDVEKFLAKQDTYTLHKPIRRKFQRNKTKASGIDTDWQADLCDLVRLKRYNKGNAYVLTVIDVLSKYAWAEPVENKKPETVAKAFKKILKENGGRKPWRLLTDKGKEFVGAPFQNMLKENEIKFIQTESPDVKASIAERYNRTLKSRLWKYFTKNSTLEYVSVLPKIVLAINKSYHRSIRKRPIDVNVKNAHQVHKILYGKKQCDALVKYKFEIGDKVRIAEYKHVFKKGYLPNFTQEIFTITERLNRKPPVYRIQDYNQEPISGIFYEQELVKVISEGSDQVYKIEKILRKRKGRNNKIECFVKWQGYPEKFNQWIPQSDLITTTTTKTNKN
jgi:hypothetical protein